MKQMPLLFLTTSFHLIILLLFCITFEFSTKKINLGKSHAVSSYVYEEKSLPSPSIVKDDISQIIAKRVITTIPLKKSFAEKKKPSNVTHRTVREGNGKPISELVALLHAAIEAEQRYPESAIQMERSGVATLIFLLFPDGHVEHLRIAKTSGTDVIDEAALAAVKSAVPFRGVTKFLVRPEEYQVNVEFQLE